MPNAAQVSCLFGMNMTDKSDAAVREAIRLVETTNVPHRVFVCTFLNYAAVEAIVSAYETSATQ